MNDSTDSSGDEQTHRVHKRLASIIFVGTENIGLNYLSVHQAQRTHVHADITCTYIDCPDGCVFSYLIRNDNMCQVIRNFSHAGVVCKQLYVKQLSWFALDSRRCLEDIQNK